VECGGCDAALETPTACGKLQRTGALQNAAAVTAAPALAAPKGRLGRGSLPEKENAEPFFWLFTPEKNGFSLIMRALALAETTLPQGKITSPEGTMALPEGKTICGADT
jgi:hypothetical protein